MPGRLDIITIDSEVLAATPWAHPTERRVPVWVPPSYDRDPGRRFPVIYVLAGFGGTGVGLFHGTPWQPGLGDRLERLIGDGAMGDVVVVAPDGFNRFGGGQYLDSPVAGRFETHICHEVIPEIDRRYRTVPTRDARAIGGKSSGGFGALTLAMQQPDLFSAVASHAGDCYFELSILGDIPKAFRTLRRHGGIEGFLHHFDTAPKKKSEDVATIMMLALGAAYAPDPTNEYGFALPFDTETGELDQETWRRFKAWDPIERVATHVEALRRMRLIFLDAGTRDEWALDLGTRVLANRMRAHDLAVEHQEFDDGHMGTAYRYEVSLPRLAAVIGAAGQAPSTRERGGGERGGGA